MSAIVGLACLFLACLADASIARAAEALSPAVVAKQIDALVDARLKEAGIAPSAAADEAELHRRAYLDLLGRIPTFDETTAYLASEDPNKQADLINSLLDRKEYGRHFATIWRDLIVDPEDNDTRGNYSWQYIDWLTEELNKGTAWNELTARMLTVEGDAKKQPESMFLLAHRMNAQPQPSMIIRTVGPLWMGIQLQCAECHNHPFVDGWDHDDFWSMAAFFGHLRDGGKINNGQSKEPMLTEVDPEPDPDPRKRARQNLPLEGAKIAIPDPTDPNKTLREVAARFFKDETPTLPEQGPYRETFAAWLTSPDNAWFARAYVNRLWAHCFARGLVHPVDAMHPDNPATHPEILDLLTREAVASGFDQKHLLRCITATTAYQRTSRPTAENAGDEKLLSHMPIKQLSASVLLDTLATAMGQTPQAGKNRDRFTSVFDTRLSDDLATEFTHGVPQALYLLNSRGYNSRASSLGKATSGKQPAEAVENIYLTVLSRQPTPAEVERMVRYVGEQENQSQAYVDVMWVLLNSAECVMNH